jgi:hypothetical protein
MTEASFYSSALLIRSWQHGVTEKPQLYSMILGTSDIVGPTVNTIGNRKK